MTRDWDHERLHQAMIALRAYEKGAIDTAAVCGVEAHRKHFCDHSDAMKEAADLIEQVLGGSTRPFPTNPATHAQVEANRPVGVRSGDAVQFIEG